MNSLLAPGPWHVTPDDHIVRDINGSPIAVVLARYPQAHAELIADLPNRVRHIEESKDILIRELQDRLAHLEGEVAQQDKDEEALGHWEILASQLSNELDYAMNKIESLEKSLISAQLSVAQKND